jgi:hypothetical protein
MTRPWLGEGGPILDLRALEDGEALETLMRAARIDDREWRYLGDLMEEAGCAVKLSELRMAHPEFDGDLPNE